MIDILNSLLSPFDTFVKKYKKVISYFLLLVTFLAFCYYVRPYIGIENGTVKIFPYAGVTGTQKESGEQALNLLWFILWIPIFARVFQIRLAQSMMAIRKELGILMGVLAFIHGGMYIFPYWSELSTRGFWITNGFISYLAFGFFAFILTIPLTLTSNNWSMKLLGSKWKMLHRSAYVILLFTIAHVVLLKWFLHFEAVPLIFFILYLIGKLCEWNGVSFGKKTEKGNTILGQKWLCVPCGFIYDPAIGDIDSGIKPGTEFRDIPDSWSCPLCGVKKSDFIPYNEDEEEATSIGVIKEKKHLNPSTVELIVETEDSHKSKPGQFMSFLWKDDLGQFHRSYSIAKEEGKLFTFLIKLSENGRGAKCILSSEIGDVVRIRSIAGRFVLLPSKKEKIFIATGTGLAPIYRMIIEDNKQKNPSKKSLYFSVSTKEELFYVNELKNIKNLSLSIHITREDIEGYEFGRVNLDTIVCSNETEWYLCGNPKMVTETRLKLLKKGYSQIYCEEF